MDVETFSVRLTTLPYLTRTDIASYQQRSKIKSVNLNELFGKAQAMNARRRNFAIQEKIQEFKSRVSPLPKDIYTRIVSTITPESDVSKLKQEAESILKKRDTQQTGQFKANFFETIKKLNLNKNDVNNLVRRLDRGEDVNLLIKEAYNLQRNRQLKTVSSERKFLKNALNRVGLNQGNKNVILSRFQPDKQVVTQLIQEGKRLKQQRDIEIVEKEKRKLIERVSTLGINSQVLKQVRNAKTKSRILALKKNIENKGQNKKNTQIATRKLNLTSLVKNLGMYSQFAGEIENIQTLKDANVVQVTVREAGKLNLMKNASNVGDFTSRIMSIKNVSQLVPMKKLIEQTRKEMKVAKQKAENDKLNKRKQVLSFEVQSAKIPENKKKLFINRLKLKKVDIPKLQSELNNIIKDEKSKKKQNELNELKRYATRFNIDPIPFIQDFQTSNISLNAIKKKVDEVVMKKKTLKEMKNTLNRRIRKASLNKSFAEKLNNIKTKNDAMSLNIEVEKAYKTKIKTNKKTLSNLAIESGLNLMTNIVAVDTINALKQANRVTKFQSKVQLEQMAKRLGVNVPITDVKTNKNVKNVKTKIENAYNTKQKQLKNELDRRRRLEKANLEVFLNKYSQVLTGDERKRFLEFFDKGANLATLKRNINRYATQKKQAQINAKVYIIRTFLNALGMVPGDQQFFVRRVIAGQNIDTVKKDAKMYMTRILNDLRRSNADKMSDFLKDLKIKPQNVDRIMKKFATTYINMNTLKNEAKKIENFRNHGNWVETNDEFLDFVNELPMSQDDKVKIKSNFDSDFVNFNAIVNTTIKTALNTQNEKNNTIRRELMAYINNHKLNVYNKRKLMKKFNTTNKDVSAIKNEANMIKRNIIITEQLKKREERLKYLNKFKILTNREKMYLLSKNNSEAEKYHNRRKRELRFELRRYIVDKLGLTMDHPEIIKIFEKFDTAPEKYDEYAQRATEIKKLRNEKNRLKSKTRNSKILEDIDEIKNLVDVAKINSKINKDFMIKMKKKLSNLILNSGIKVKLNLSKVRSPQQINTIMVNIKKVYETKRFKELQQLKRSLMGLSPQNQNEVLQEFTTTDIQLKTSMKKVTEIREKMRENKHKTERDTLHKLMKNQLSLSSKDISDLLTEFDKVKNVEKIRVKAMQVKKLRTNENIAENRLKLVKILDGIDLSDTDKKSILIMYDKKPTSVMLYETTAKQLSSTRKKELKNKEKSNLNALLKTLKLSSANSKQILNSFERVPDFKLPKAKSEAIRVRKKRDREKLINALKPLSISENDRKQFLANSDNVNKVIQKAQLLHTQQRSKNALQTQLRQYIASKNLGNNAKNLLNQVNTTTTQDGAKYIREKADQMKLKADTSKISKKKTELSRYMNDMKVNLSQRGRFLQGIQGNTNINAIKRMIQQTLKAKTNKTGMDVQRRTQVKLYINTLNLPNSEKQKLLRIPGNVGEIRRQATRLLEQIKKNKLNATKAKASIKAAKILNNQRLLQSVQLAKLRNTRVKAREYLKSLKRTITLKDRRLLQKLNTQRITLPQFKQMTTSV
jgi:hypothetical protein